MVDIAGSFGDISAKVTGLFEKPSAKDQGNKDTSKPQFIWSEEHIRQSDVPITLADLEYEFGTYEGSNNSPVSGRKVNENAMIIELNIDNPPPPLRFLINPKSMTMTFNKMIRPQRVRGQYILQHAGDEMPTIDYTGNIGGCYNIKHGVIGQYFKFNKKTEKYELGKVASAAYQWLMKLLAFYKNNGCNINADDRRLIDSVGSVSIIYDGTIFVGSFRSFEFTEDETRPNTIDYSFSFKVRNIIGRG